MNDLKNLIIDAVKNLDEEAVLNYVYQAIGEGMSSRKILKYIQSGVNQVGKLFEAGDYYVADLMMAGIIFKDILEIDAFKPVDDDLSNYQYTILIGTVYDDLHDIGKGIFSSMVKAAGFQVIDIGIDVQAQTFADNIRRIQPDIVAMSGVLFSSLKNMANVVEYLEDCHLREQVKLIVGGGNLTPEANAMIRADAFTNDASEGLEICKKWAAEWNQNNARYCV